MAIWPMDTKWKVSQEFGTNPGGHNPPGGHTGIDVASPEGTPVYAMEDGVVTHADWGTNLPGDDSAEGWASRLYLMKSSVGIGVVLLHASYYSTYSHLSRTDLNIGDRVKRGQIIGYVGQTGLSFGAHLHWEVLPLNPNWSNGTYGRLNPRLFLSETTTQKTETIPMAYPYTLITEWTSPNQSTRASFGFNGKIDSAIIHWWNEPDKAGTFEGTSSWLCNPTAQVSAHYVISGRRVACLVSPDFAAWHSGNGPMNGRSVGLELDPRNPEGTVETAAQVLYEIEKAYNTSLNIYGHKDIVPTGCPGAFYGQIQRIVDLINGLHTSDGKATTVVKPVSNVTKPVVKTPVKEKPMSETNKTGWDVWRYVNPNTGEKRDAYALLRGIVSGIGELLKNQIEINRKLDEVLARLPKDK